MSSAHFRTTCSPQRSEIDAKAYVGIKYSGIIESSSDSELVCECDPR